MIDKISFKNYKIFKDSQTIELKPITVIFGKNNSGKSAIVKLPKLIESSLKSTVSTPIQINNDGVEFGLELRDLVYGKAIRAIEFDLQNTNSNKKLSLAIYISRENNKEIAKIESWKLNSEFEIRENDGFFFNHDGIKQDCKFNGFNLIGDFNQDILGASKDLVFKGDFIGPIRSFPEPVYRIDPTYSLDQGVGSKGENAYQILILDAVTTEKKILTAVSEWYKKNFEGWEIFVDQDKAPIYQIEIRREHLKQNLRDAGIGMSQVLPIVVRAMTKCMQDSLIMIEEPETHLHPAAHGNLAELLVDSVIEDGFKHYLVETHSLNFILRLRSLIAQKKLNKDDLKIYYVDFLEDSNCSIVKEIEVNEDGTVNYWPHGVFNEAFDEIVAMRNAQLNN